MTTLLTICYLMPFILWVLALGLDTIQKCRIARAENDKVESEMLKREAERRRVIRDKTIRQLELRTSMPLSQLIAFAEAKAEREYHRRVDTTTEGE